MKGALRRALAHRREAIKTMMVVVYGAVCTSWVRMELCRYDGADGRAGYNLSKAARINAAQRPACGVHAQLDAGGSTAVLHLLHMDGAQRIEFDR